MNVEVSVETLLKQVAEKPVPMVRLACLLLTKGQSKLARELCARAVALAPDDGEVRVLAAEVFSQDAPRFYFSMVLDSARHKLYELAFARVIRPGCRVLDIGSGTGLFALMAARAGAGEVITCEAKPAVAAAVSEVVAHNGLGDRIRVIAKHSSDLEIGVDLNGPADVVVWDNLANNLVGAGALPSIEQAVRRLVRPGARFIPARGAIRVALADDREPQFRRMDTVEGFDMSPFNRLAPPRYNMSDDVKRFALRSEAANLFRFDFESGGPFAEARESVLLTSTGGNVNGIAQWMRLELDAEVEYENPPPSYKTAALAPVFYPLPQSIDLLPGATLTVFGAHDRVMLRIWANTPRKP
jgi:protein arginine N-methyltransferase 7